MAKHGLGRQFSDIDIASALNQFDLKVPPNQCFYAWEDSHVRTLFEDFSGAISSHNPTYFLGTIVLTHGVDGKLEVADGQQRLATTPLRRPTYSTYSSAQDAVRSAIVQEFRTHNPFF